MSKTRALIVTITAVLVVMAILGWSIMKTVKDKRDFESVLEEKSDSIRHWTNKYGKVVAEKNLGVMSFKNFTHNYNNIVTDLQKQLNLSKAELKHMKSVTRTVFVATNSGETKGEGKVKIDSVTGKIITSSYDFNINDGYLNLDAVQIDSSLSWTYQYGDTLTTAGIMRRKCFICKERYYVNAYFQNPNAQVTNITNVEIRQFKDKRWVVSAGVSYNPFSKHETWIDYVQPSIHIGRALFKF